MTRTRAFCLYSTRLTIRHCYGKQQPETVKRLGYIRMLIGLDAESHYEDAQVQLTLET